MQFTLKEGIRLTTIGVSHLIIYDRENVIIMKTVAVSRVCANLEFWPVTSIDAPKMQNSTLTKYI